jgi:hypothetical protein
LSLLSVANGSSLPLSLALSPVEIHGTSPQGARGLTSNLSSLSLLMGEGQGEGEMIGLKTHRRWHRPPPVRYYPCRSVAMLVPSPLTAIRHRLEVLRETNVVKVRACPVLDTGMRLYNKITNLSIPCFDTESSPYLFCHSEACSREDGNLKYRRIRHPISPYCRCERSVAISGWGITPSVIPAKAGIHYN